MKLFFILQFLDIITTLVFRHMGIAETNPLVSSLMRQVGTLPSLMIVKSVAISIGLACGMASHPTFTRRINYVYIFFVAMNILTICNALR